MTGDSIIPAICLNNENVGSLATIKRKKKIIFGGSH